MVEYAYVQIWIRVIVVKQKSKTIKTHNSLNTFPIIIDN